MFCYNWPTCVFDFINFIFHKKELQVKLKNLKTHRNVLAGMFLTKQ